MGYAWDILAPANITRIVQQTQDVLTLPQPLLWWERAAKVNASDDELTMREKSYVYAADIISTDAGALIRDSGEFTFDQSQIVKLKHGFGISESMVMLLRRIEANKAMDNEMLTFKGYIARRAAELQLGLKQRGEALLVGGILNDSVDYKRLGISISGTFGMPSDLKFTAGTAWTSASTATPIADIIAVLKYGSRKYGEGYDRVTMSYTALQKIIATTEFKDIYKGNAFTWSVADANITSRANNPNFYVGFVANFIGASMAASSDGGGRQVKIEIYEGQYRDYSSKGTINATKPYQPENVVFFSNSGDDGSSSGWDWGNGEVMETVIGQLGGTGVIGGFSGQAFGPVGYTTQADPNLNPPGLVMWAVTRGGPRKHRDTCTAKLTAWTV